MQNLYHDNDLFFIIKRSYWVCTRND